MSLTESLKRVRGAVGRDIVATHAYYFIDGGRVTTTDGRMVASTPIDDDRTYMVPADQFDAVLSRMPDVPTIEVNADHVLVKCGRYRSKVSTLETDGIIFPQPQGDIHKVPKTLGDKLDKLRPFISENAQHRWAGCYQFRDGGIFATNNVTLARTPASGFSQGFDLLLPHWAVDFVRALEGLPGKMQIEENSATFHWKDTTWLRTQLLVDKFPEKAIEYLSNVAPPAFEITDEWREAYDTVSGLIDSTTAQTSRDAAVVAIYADKITGVGDKTNIEAAVTSQTPGDGSKDHSKWTIKFFSNVVKASKAMDLSLYPKPCSFQGDDLIGLMVGRY